MATIADISEQAQLSRAAYALNLQSGMFGAGPGSLYVKALTDAGMSAKQAEEFANKYRVIAQSPESGFLGSGFSGTVFQNVETGEIQFAIRGSEGSFNGIVSDWIGTNLGDIGFDGIAVSQAIAMFNWLQRMIAAPGTTVVQYDYHPGAVLPFPVAPSITIHTETATSELWGYAGPTSVTGHSLGGQLAMILSRLAPSLFGSVYTFNAPGFDTAINPAPVPLTSEGFFDLLRNAPAPIPLTGEIGTAWNTPIMNHLDVEGDSVHDIGTTPGTQQVIFSEDANQGFYDAHLIGPIADALAVYDLFARLDPVLNTNTTLALTEINDILKAGASDHTKSLENALDSIRRILLGSDVSATAIDNRDQFYKNYYALVKTDDPNNPSPEFAAFDALAGNAVLRTLVGESQTSLEDLAKTTGPDGLAYRYALQALNPFALLGADYQTLHNALGQLERYEPTTRTGTLTDAWLEDRAAFLANKILAGVADSQVGSFPAVPQSAELQHFEDRSGSVSYHVYVGANASGLSSAVLPPSDVQQILFGGDKPDTLVGNDQADKLYGGAGNDFLTGGKGDDYLEGGYGNDTYNYNAGDGHDDILDIDGQGRILYTDSSANETLLTGGRQLTQGGNLYESSTDPTIQYRKETNGDLTVVIGGVDDLTIRDYRPGDLGINLIDLSGSLLAFRNATRDPNDWQTAIAGDQDPNILDDDIDADPITALISGGAGADILTGHAGEMNYIQNIALHGGSGDDIIEGESFYTNRYYEIGKAAFEAEQGILQPGIGVQAFGEAGNDRFLGSLRDDTFDGGADHDFADAYVGDDTVLGGTGNDLLNGEEGADLLDGGDDADRLGGGAGDDHLIGGAGADQIYGDSTYVGLTWDGTSLSQVFGTLNSGSFGIVRDVAEAEAGDDFLEGGAGDDQLYGGAGNDVLDGGDDADLLQGEGGDDTLFGGTGDDRIFGDSSVDAATTDAQIVLTAGTYTYFWRSRDVGQDGNDYIDAGDGNDFAWGGGGDDYLYGGDGNDQLYGGLFDGSVSGNDTLSGGTGADILFGEDGDDTYRYDVGDGNDVAVDSSGDDRVIFGPGIGPENIQLAVAESPDTGTYSLVLDMAGADRLKLQDWFSAAERIETVEFADGTTWDSSYLLDRTRIITGNGGYNDTNSSDTTYDTFLGSDVADGFEISVSDNGGIDQLRFDQAFLADGPAGPLYVTPTLQSVVQDGNDLVLNLVLSNGITGSTRVLDYFGGGEMESIFIADVRELVSTNSVTTTPGTFVQSPASGVLYERFSINNSYFNISNVVYAGGEGDDVITPEPGLLGNQNFFYGNAGDDTLIGTASRDILNGGAGADRMEGGAGTDTYYADPSEADAIFDDNMGANGGIDELVVLGGYAFDDLPLRRDANDLMIGAIRIENFFGDSDNQIETLSGSDADGPWQATLPSRIAITPGINAEIIDHPGNAEQTLVGDASANAIYGDDGVDIIDGDAGNDIIAGGTGADEIMGGEGSDVYLFNRGDGQDVLDNYSGKPPGEIDALSFGASIAPEDIYGYVDVNGTLILMINPENGTAADSISTYWFFQDGSGNLVEDPNSQIARAQFVTSTATWIFDLAGIVGELGASLLGATATNPVALFTPDTIAAYDITATATAAGGEYAYNYGTAGEFRSSTGPGNAGTVGDDDISGGDGPDTIGGFSGNDSLNGGNGDDLILGGSGNDLIHGGTGDDALYGGKGNDSVFGDDGNDLIYGGDFFENGNFLNGDDGQHWGNDLLDGGAGNDTLIGGPDNDTLRGGEGDDILIGLDGVNVLDGGPGDDILNGLDPEFNDTVSGGGGENIFNTYVINLGGGFDSILVEGPKNSTVRFGPGIAPADLIVQMGSNSNPPDILDRGGPELAIGFGQDEGMAIFGLNGAVSDLSVGQFVFADGQQMSLEQVIGLATGGVAGVQDGTPAADVLIGSVAEDFIRGFAGDDTLIGGGEDDILWGGDGDDLIVGASGNDQIAGDDGSDVIVGGKGNDELGGGAGSNTYLFNRGDGQDSVDDFSGVNSALSFGQGIQPDDVRAYMGRTNFSASYYIDYLTLLIPSSDGSTPDSVIVARDSFSDFLSLVQFLGNGADRVADFASLVNARSAELFAADAENPVALFASGALDTFDLTGQVAFAGGQYAINYSATGDVFTAPPVGNHSPTVQQPIADQTANEGEAFSLILSADTFTDSDTGDTLTHSASLADGSAFPSWLGFDANTLTFTGAPANGDDGVYDVRVTATDTAGASASDVFVLTVANTIPDVIQGSAGDDILSGTAANDTFQGGAGNDTLSGGAGDDTYLFNVGDGVDTLVDAASPGEGNQVVFGAGITADQLTLGLGSLLIQVGDQGDAIDIPNFDPSNVFGPHAIETFTFDDGAVLSYAELLALGFDIDGTAGDDILSGTNTTDRLNGLAGDDVLAGGAGDDVYLFNLGDGRDQITDSAGADAIQFGPNITQADLTVTRTGDELVITLNGSDGITVANWYQGNRIERVDFADASTLTADALEALVATPNTPPEVAVALADQFTDANSAYSFTVPGTTFTDPDVGDTLTYGVTLADGSALPSWLAFDPITRTFTGTPENGDIGRVDLTVTAMDEGGLGASESFALRVANSILGTQYSDTLTGSAAIDHLNGAGGGDILLAGDGDDLIDTGYEADELYGEAGDDTFRIEGIQAYADRVNGGPGFDRILGGSGDDLIRLCNFQADDTVELIDGKEGVNVVAGRPIYDNVLDFRGTTLLNIAHIEGSDDGNTIYGSQGDDTIRGGAHTDYLYGEAGDDTFLIEGAQSYADRINGGDGFDRILGGSGDDVIRLYNFTGEDTVERIDGKEGTNILAGRPTYDNVLDFRYTELLGIARIEGGDDGNIIYGSQGDDTIKGGARTDYLYGEAGDDTFLIEGIQTYADRVNGGAGFDQIVGSSSDDVIYLSNFEGENTVEQIDGQGGVNVILNSIYGGTLDFRDTTLISIARIEGGPDADIIYGTNGKDVIVGKASNDELRGGAGDDTYLFGPGDGDDLVSDNDGNDTVDLDSSRLDIVLAQSGDDLLITLHSTGDTITVGRWYADASQQIETINTQDGSMLQNAQVEQLIQAMSQFSATHGGITWDQAIDQNPSDVQAVLAAYWQPSA